MTALRKPLPVAHPQAIVITEPGVGAEVLGLDEGNSPVLWVPPETLVLLAANPGLPNVLLTFLQFVADDPQRIAVVDTLLRAASAVTKTGEGVTLRLDLSRLTNALEVVPVAADPSPPPSHLSPGMARALARGEQRVAAILTQPEMLNGPTFASLLGVSTQTLAEWRAHNKVLALSGEKRGFRFPDWQITPAGTLLPGLRELHGALRGEPWLVYRFLMRKHPDLGGRTGIEALKGGDIGATIEAAEAESDTFS